MFDAADFFRCGRDLFVTRSNVASFMGVAWLRWHLGEGFRIHEIESRRPNPMHIDTTVLPLAEGKLPINPEYMDPDRLPDCLKTWDILVASEPTPINDGVLKITSLCGSKRKPTLIAIRGRRSHQDAGQKLMARYFRHDCWRRLMATYTFKPNASAQFVSWDDPTVWTGGVVPNSADADVVFPQVITVSTGSVYNSYITIQTGEAFATRSIQLDRSDDLLINGSLNVSGDLNAGGELNFNGGALSAGSLEIGGYDIQGSGQVNANSVTNDSLIIGGITLNTSYLQDNGKLQAISGNLTVNTNAGGLSTLSDSTLTGGSYEADSGSTLSINAGSIITSDSAMIELGGGTIQSFDNGTGNYIPLTTSLKNITAAGTLAIQNATYAFGSLSDAGTITLANPMFGSPAGSPGFTSDLLTITSSGQLSGYGNVNGAIFNDGLIKSGLNPVLGGSGAQQQTLTLNGPVSGSGSLEIVAGTAASRFNGLAISELCLTGADSETVAFDNNIGELSLASPLSFSGAIAPAAQGGDQVVLENTSSQSITGTSYVGTASGGTLTLQQATGSISLNFQGNYSLSSFTVSAGPQQLSSDPPSTLITVGSAVCFAAGTLIRTATGPIAVEHLREGDRILTTDDVRPVRWLGHRTIDCRRHPRPHEVMPICIAAHTIGVGRPSRDLWVSPGHAICIDAVGEVLIPAAALVKGTTIKQLDVGTITYWHVELDRHQIVLAEDLPCESYLEMGNRLFFTGPEPTMLHAAPDAPVTETHDDFCRPFHRSGPVVDFVRERLAARSHGPGWVLKEEPFADLHLMVDGKRIDPLVKELSARFDVSLDARDVWLVSNTAIPAEIGAGADLRKLGVCIERLVVSDGFGLPRTIKPNDARLQSGFHHVEDGPTRWTAGRAQLPTSLWNDCSGMVFLRVDLARPALPCWSRCPGSKRLPSNICAA